jgi:hypothetical protein
VRDGRSLVITASADDREVVMTERPLAIIVPIKNRSAYLKVFLDAVPRYLREINGLSDFKIFVAEQVDDVPFNASLARNVGARFALDEERYETLLFQDVDMIPVHNVDYSYREKNVCWFMNPGGCKIHPQAFLDANGYNPSVWGWCSEDYEFYSRICDFGHEMETWYQIPESLGTVVVNLDLEPQSYDRCVAHSMKYFGHDGTGPLHISYNHTMGIRPESQVPKKYGWQMEGWHFDRLTSRHRDIIDFLVSMPLEMKREYARRYGLNWINRDKVTVLTNTRQLCHLQYRWFDVVD